MCALTVKQLEPPDPVTTESMPHIHFPPLEYRENLSPHEGFVLAAREQLIWDAVNDCAMIKRSERESLAQVALANAVNDCLEKTHNIRPDSAESVKKTVKGKSNSNVEERVDIVG